MRRIVKTSPGLILATILAATLVFAAPSPSEAVYLPDTGQTKCYQAVNPYAEIPCEGTGQDGEYDINPLSCTDNGDGTVTDNNTGLMWQQEDDGATYNWHKASGTYEPSYNPSGESVCGSLPLGNHSDWRLPTKKELMSIVDYAVPNPGPTIRPIFTNAKSSLYWSSTTYASYPGYAWYLGFYDGHVYTSYKSKDDKYVRCVRGGQDTGSNLTDNSNGTVTDSETGLLRQQEEPGYMTWGAALSYCQNLSLADFSDWRLPNVKELESLVDDARWNPAIGTTIFPSAASSPYWSSTTEAKYPWDAWIVGFGNGQVGSDSKYFASVYVRCVRGGDSRPAWRSGESDLGGGWKWLDWFGYYNSASDPWIYHQEHQWFYPYDDGSGGVFFWYNDMQEFVWTTPTTYPYLYRFGVSPGWLWYQKDSANPRWFYNYSTAGWEQLP